MNHGTLATKDGQTKIKGTRNYRAYGSVSFTPDGATCAIIFSEQEWDFVADKSALPSEPGYYVASLLVEGDEPSAIAAIFRLHSGKWSCVNSYHGDPERWAQDILERQGLTRVKFVVDES